MALTLPNRLQRPYVKNYRSRLQK